MDESVFIGLGSNMGDKAGYIRKALDMLDEHPQVEVAAVAPLYLTAPVGYVDQDWFLNTVAEIKTTLEPGELLAALQDIETRLGRKRTIRWGPRVVDLDLLLYGREEIARPALTLPHPRMQERAFVMVPLADLAPDLILPGGGRVGDIAAALSREQQLTRWKDGKNIF